LFFLAHSVDLHSRLARRGRLTCRN